MYSLMLVHTASAHLACTWWGFGGGGLFTDFFGVRLKSFVKLENAKKANEMRVQSVNNSQCSYGEMYVPTVCTCAYCVLVWKKIKG